MEANLQAIKALYQDEIDAYKRQIDDLKVQNKSSHEKNDALLDKVRSLNDLIEQAHVANKDLHTAFEHVREENRQLKLQTGNIDNNAIQTEGDELALETCQRQYINIARESVAWISEKDKLTQRLRFLERECERYTRDNVTLGKQVRHLLKALEEERGMIIRKSEQVTEYGQPVNASDVIDNHLVTFESIEQLQKQNQKLLSLIKDMSEREEEREIQVENEDIRRLNSDLETLNSELDSVKGDRERIMNAFNMILKERDLFKILLCKTRQVEHLTPEIFQKMVTIACQSGPAIAGPQDTQDKDAHIVDLKAMISKLENDLSELREEFEKAREKNEGELKLKSQLLEQAHIKILTESQQGDVLKERNQLLETNMKTLMDEFDEVRTKLQKTTFEMEQEKQKCKDLTEHKDILSGALEQIKRLQGQVEYEIREKLQAEINELQSDIQELQADNQKLAEESQKYQEENQVIQGDNQRLQCDIGELQDDIQKLHIETESLENANKKLQDDYQKLLDDYQNLQGDNQKPRDENRKLLEEISRLQDEIRRLQNNIRKNQSDYAELRADFFEVQRLRNLERLKHLELSRNYFKLKIGQEPSKSPIMPEVTQTNVEETKKEEKRDAPPVRGIVLKRRKIV